VGRELLAMLPQEGVLVLRQQVDERRVVIRLKAQRLYGTAVDVGD
jgi:hypothetical protein